MPQNPRAKTAIRILNLWLRCEHAAVFAYGRAIRQLETSPRTRLLAQCRASHLRRVDLLADHVRQFGGRPRLRGGMLGVIAVLLQTLATLMGERLALRVLSIGERLGQRGYRRALRGLQGRPRLLAKEHLLPEQHWTAASIAAVA